MARSANRQGGPGARRIGSGATRHRPDAQCRPDYARVRARLSRFTFRGPLAQGSPAAGRLVGRLRGTGPGFQRNEAAAIIMWLCRITALLSTIPNLSERNTCSRFQGPREMCSDDLFVLSWTIPMDM